MHNKIKPVYKGRFAPSPTGKLHFGTLVTAVASYLEAKKNQGQWLIRIEDVDTTRRVKNADTELLKTLEQFGFEWDTKPIYQSKRTAYYQYALQQLAKQNLVFPCRCSRKQQVKTQKNIYSGKCKNRPFKLSESDNNAIRLQAKNITIKFNDLIWGEQNQNIKKECGDFIIKRRDTLFAYQLAVVVDDEKQGITDIVRGGDLLDSTPRQIYLQNLLHYNTPNYCHIPLVLDQDGQKISKSEGATPLDPKNREVTLVKALKFLSQKVPNTLEQQNLQQIWAWALQHWQHQLIKPTHDKIKS